MKRIRILFFCCAYLMNGHSAKAQEFIAKLDSLYMVMGDQQYLSLTFQGDNNSDPSFDLTTLDTCTFFEIIDQTAWIKTSTPQKITIEKKIKFSIYDSGDFIIPTLKATLPNDTLYTYEIPLKVAHIEPDSTGLLPIKDIIREKKQWTDYLGWIFGILFILLSWALYRYIQHRKNATLKEKIIEVPIVRKPHEIALEKLYHLRDGKLWERGEIKIYHSELTYIVREYLEKRFVIPALESTSHEIIRDVKSLLQEQSVQSIHDILNIADWVKFAKGIPEEAANALALDKAIQLVLDTKEADPIQSSNLTTNP